jgi:hypothetical protein
MRKFTCFGILLTIGVAHGEGRAATNDAAAIPWSQIGAKAGADYNGDGLAVTPTESGARLHCVFQRLDGVATSQGLWLTSTVTNTFSDRFRVTAMEIGRRSAKAGFDSRGPAFNIRLADKGNVSVKGQTVRFNRPGLTEEYSVSMDGVRQDFIVEKAPSNSQAGELVVKLAVTGAKVETATYGARLVLESFGRKIAYSRLRVTDATGNELPARIEVCPVGDDVSSLKFWSDPGDFFEELSPLAPADTDVKLAVVVNDSDAVYPVRIDPTFSDANWVSMGGFPAVSGWVSAAAIDGLGNLYIGGSFTNVGNIFATNIAQWNGSSWSTLGSGINSIVNALAVSGSTLYAGGQFTTAGAVTNANYIAQWNGSSWAALGSGMNDWVYALAVSGRTLYAGGGFTTAGGNEANSIAQWNGTNWSAMGSGMVGFNGDDGDVYALAVSGSNLYAGGYFAMAGGSFATVNVAQWNGSNWSSVGDGILGMSGDGYGVSVSALAVMGSNLYAGGYFTTPAGFRRFATNVAQWNGQSWSALGSGIGPDGGDEVSSLAVWGNTLYAGGTFTYSGDSSVVLNNLAQWNGSSWSSVGSGVDGSVYALAVSGGALYAVGGHIAQWNGSSWSTIGSAPLNGVVDTLAVSGGTLYAGGGFTAAGGIAANHIAQWNGSSWSALGAGMSGGFTGGYVYSLAVSGSTLYAGGDFTLADGTPANYIAQWNGTNWSALGSGMSGFVPSVSALAVSGGTLYAGGDFTNAGGTGANYIAQWNGSNWSALGSGVDFVVTSLAVSGGTLYAGGGFTTAGGSAANYVAEWNGSNWSALGSGMNGVVSALAVSGSTLYAGGKFTTAGGSAVNYIAQWDGTKWSALGSGVNGYVNTLAVSGGALYAGGDFMIAGGSAANYIAQWNGSSWSPLGSGMGGANPYVYALAVSDSTLYAGGSFTAAGTNASDYAAETIVVAAPPSYAISVSAAPTSDGAAIGSGTFSGGSTQTVSAEANSGYAFVDWTENGTVVSSLANYTFTLNSNVALVANFTTLPTMSFGQAWVGTDDFSSGISANWMVYQHNQGQMFAVGTNQHLSFIVGASATTEQNAEVVWNGTPAVTDDWTMDITGHNSASWSANGASQLQLWLVNSANTGMGYRIAMAGGSDQTSEYQFTTLTPSYGPRQNVPATNADFGLRLVHRGGVAGDIEAWYDPTGTGVAWTLLDTMSMAAFWPGVVARNTFTVAIVADTYYGPIAEGQLWADNFRITNSAIGSPLPQVGLAKVFQPTFAVQPTFANLILGTNYQLQVSGDLNTWTNQGSALTATSSSIVYPQYFNVDTWNKLFFRLQVAP